MKLVWPSTTRCRPGPTPSRFQNTSVEMPMMTPGVSSGETIAA